MKHKAPVHLIIKSGAGPENDTDSRSGETEIGMRREERSGGCLRRNSWLGVPRGERGAGHYTSISKRSVEQQQCYNVYRWQERKQDIPDRSHQRSTLATHTSIEGLTSLAEKMSCESVITIHPYPNTISLEMHHRASFILHQVFSNLTSPDTFRKQK